MKFNSIIVLIASMLASSHVMAESQSYTLPTDNKMVNFNYDKNDTYTILTQPMHVTDLEFGSDEILQGKAIGDPVQWKVDDGGDRHILIRPSKSSLETSLTVFTDKRTYQFTLRSSPDGGKWYQHVDWQYPDRMYSERIAAKKKAREDKEEQEALNKTIAVKEVSIENFYTDYKVTGSNDLKPVLVADDGKRTTLKFNQLQPLPAVFMKGSEAKYAMVNYDVSADGRTITVQRVANVMFLKLNDNEVKIERANKISDDARSHNLKNIFSF